MGSSRNPVVDKLLAELIIAMTLMQERGRERQLEDSKKEGKGL